VDGELAINTTDKKVYVRVGTSIVEVANVLNDNGFIDGFKLEYVSATSLRCLQGSAYIPSVGAIVNSPSSITKSSLSLSANTWYHVYFYLNAGTPDIEIVTTAPSAPYFSTARTKTSDTSRRYVGSVRTNASSQIVPFAHYPYNNEVKYRNNLSDNIALASGTATSPVTVSLSTWLPVTARIAQLFAETGAGDLAFISNPDLTSTPSTNILFYLRASQQIYGTMEVSSAQSVNYVLGPSVTGLSIYCSGYNYER
jgi:hypothetical protein